MGKERSYLHAMDQQQQQRVNEAAEQFTDALVQSYKAVADRGASAQDRGAQLTEVFFNQTINNLRAQAEENRQATQQLVDQQQRQADAAQTLTQESVGAYMEFMDSMFSYWQGGLQTAEQGARETEKATKGEKKS
jgi:predicted RNA polymerase sigma factor